MNTFEQTSFAKNKNRNLKRGALNFEQMARQGNTFINEVAMKLGVHRNIAARITKAVIHAVRDKLPPNDAIEFAQGLPMALKAVFIDQYDLSDAPVNIRNPHDFLDYIFYNDEFTANYDFPEQDSVENALRVVFNTLEEFMDKGQTNQVKKQLGKPISDMIDGYVSYSYSDQPLRFSND